MNSLKQRLKQYKYQFDFAKRIFMDKKFYETYKISKDEGRKKGSRTEIISFLLEMIDGVNYLEIGVRNPNDNFNKIKSKNKYSVDPGVEFRNNPVDFKITSDEFFRELKINTPHFPFDIKFDVIFIDGLHLADQVERDIFNAMDFISQKGFVVVHDCNPPTEFHARESFGFKNSPARGFWNGTTWKAFYKIRHEQNLHSICFDTDWGVGVISKNKYPEFNNLEFPIKNSFYEFNTHLENKEHYMNLQDFDSWSIKMKKTL
ncbi:class I SAM-dependent methyltransferase [Aequorivita marina]|uniref:class I SAM-dependent methyltransferase n=1 Tax=Aequorivita marina TaxID=3073654 RepID=UPI002874B2B6|nr:class I SAM-dependent methyltransferase [Aequorivita sp. S2608]MDS1298044.1 class I SAM-dependent methyltransferase [Aequorivita sp. S2608]